MTTANAITVREGDLYPPIVGAAWERVAPVVKAMHAPGFRAEGTLRVTHGSNAIARLLARLSGAPPAGEAVAVKLAVAVSGAKQSWSRSYGGHAVVTSQWVRAGRVIEAYAGLAIHFRFDVDDEGALVYRQERTTLELGPLAIPFPSFVAPRAEGRVAPSATDGAAAVRVSVSAPIVGLLVRYEGTMRPSCEPSLPSSKTPSEEPLS